MRRIAHHDDTQQSLAGAGVPQSIHGFVPNADALAVELQDGFDPRRRRILGHLQGGAQTFALLAWASATAGIRRGVVIACGFHGDAADQVAVGLARVERSGSWCMSAPQMRRPDLRAKVSSTAATRTGEQNGNSKGNTQCPSSSRFQRALLKKRWKEQ